MKRIFIALVLPESVKRELSYGVDRISEMLPDRIFRWSDSELWHITALFLGEQTDTALLHIVEAVQEVAKSTSPLEPFALTKIDYSDATQSMIWAHGNTAGDEQLQMLQQKILTALRTRPVDILGGHKRPRVHVTLARAKQRSTHLPKIDEPLNLLVPATTLEIMESFETQGERRYESLAAVSIGADFE